MRERLSVLALVVGGIVAGQGLMSAPKEAVDHYYRVVSFPKVALKSEPLERIESLEMEMHCGRFVAINRIPNDWSADVVSPVSEVTKLRMEAGHGSSELCSSSDLDGFVTVLVCEPSCFRITASVMVSSYDQKLHERKVTFKQSDLVMVPAPNQQGGANGRRSFGSATNQTSTAAASRRSP
jgi:hypothetical protein